MNEIERTDDRRRQLDDFANAPAQTNQPIPGGHSLVRPTSGLAERVIGAQPVAVYRDEHKIFEKLSQIAARAGSDWFYRFPVRGAGGGQTFIEGPSIKLANDVARIFGNCNNEIRELDVGDAWIFYAKFSDIETGFSYERAYRQRKGQTSMKTRDMDRQLDIAYQIGQSKAIRNCICNALQLYCDFAFEEARNSLIDKIEGDIEKWRRITLDGLAKLPVEINRVERVIGRVAKDWLAPDIAQVVAMGKSIRDGMATTDETFPPLTQEPAHDKTAPQGPSQATTPSETTDSAQSSEEAEGDVTEDAGALRSAFLAGQKARRDGTQRRNPPGELRTKERTGELKSWLDGWDSAGE